MNKILSSRDGSVSCELMRLNSSFNLIDPGPLGANAFSKIAYANAAPFGITGGLNAFTIVSIVKPEFTISPTPYTTYHGYTRPTGLEAVYNVPVAGLVSAADSYGVDRGVLASATGAVIPNKTLRKNTEQQRWTFIANACNDTQNKLFVDGTISTNAYTGPQTDGILKMSIPAFIASGASANTKWDGAGAGFWPQVRFALHMFFDRELSTQELYDLYGMLMFGAGYAISRASLGAFWLGRQDSTVAGEFVTLPAWAAFDTVRTMIPDLSGAGRNAYLYTNKATWTTLLDAANVFADPGIYIPRVWYDQSLSYNTRYMTLNSTGSTIS